MCNQEQDEDPMLSLEYKSYEAKIIRREDVKEGMLTFAYSSDPNFRIYLEPAPSTSKPDHPPQSTLTTLSDKEKTRLADVVEQVSAILFELDPMHINHITNLDEYDPEACAIISTLKHKESVDDVAAVVVDTFRLYFDRDISADMSDLAWTAALQSIWNICTRQRDR